MPEPLKNNLNYDSIREFALAVQSAYAPFQVDEFLKSTVNETWDGLELKARGRQLTLNLGKHLPPDYKTAIEILYKVSDIYKGWGLFSFPDFVEIFGQDEDNWDVSIAALAKFTEKTSSEFAVRPFIIKHQQRMMAQMSLWSKSENEHHRRLSSEGCRPALPWATAMNSFKKDPSPILPILEQLKTDPSLYVRKSVANNLNDISKTHPDLVIKIAKDWLGKDERTDWIVKHACRTLLKNGNREALALFGLDNSSAVVSGFALETAVISIGETLTFSFLIQAKEDTKVRLEYGVDYVKSSGKRNRKIFKISEITLKKDDKKSYSKNHSFADVSTRKHYAGTHSITLIVNGSENGTLDFELKE